MTAHTPTPWRVGDAGHTVFGPPNGTPSPAVITTTRGLHPANSAHIVRCVNAHDDLVAALTFITRCAKMKGPVGTTCYIISDAAMDSARAALAKVGS